MQLLNVDSGKQEDVAAEAVHAALANNTHIPLGGDRALVTPDGALHIVPVDQIQSAVSQGYKVPTQAELDHFAAKTKFGGAGNAAKAFAAGAARGATFGASDLGLTRYGAANPDTLQGLKEFQPEASTAGDVAGAVGSALLAPEASPAGLLSKGATGIAEHLAPEGASALRQVAAHALGMGAEGAAYGAAQSVSEASLGDPNAAAEHLVANVGLGALLGGGLGGIFKAGQVAVPASVGKAREAVAKSWRTLWGDAAAPAERRAFYRTAEAVEPELGLEATGTEGAGGAPDLSPPGPAPAPPPAAGPRPGAIPSALGKINEALTGTPAEQTVEAFQKRAGVAGETLSSEERAAFHGQLNDALQETHDAIEKASGEAGGTVRPQESAELLEGADPVKAAAELQRVKGVFQHTIAEMRAAPELYPARFPAKIDQILAGLEAGEAPGASAADIYSEITRARKAIDDKIPWGKEISGEAADAVQLTKGLRSQVKASLENDGVWGKAAARTASFNESVNDRLSALKEFRRQFMAKVPTRSGGVTWKVNPNKTNQFLNTINDPRGAMRASALREFFRTSVKHLGEMEKTYQSTQFESFDKAALERLLEKNMAQATRAQSVVAAQPGMGYGGLGNLAKVFAMGHFGGPIGAVMSLGKGALKPDAMAAGLANIERASMKGEKLIGRAMKGIFEPAGNAVKKGFGVMSEQLSPAEKLDKIKGKVEETRDHVSSAENLVDVLDRATRDGGEVAPKTMAAVHQTALRGLQFLQSKLPAEDPGTPFERAQEPSPAALMAFERYHTAVHDPLSVLDELKHGAVAPESLEALRAVYPQLYSQIGQAAMLHAATAKGDVPYRTRLILSQFLGAPLTKSLEPAAMQSVAAATQLANAQQQPGGSAPHPSTKGMQHLHVAQRAATDFQKTSLKEA